MLRGVDFDVARGSIFAVLGSNGTGKTTAVRVLSTLLKAYAGTAVVNGVDLELRRLLAVHPDWAVDSAPVNCGQKSAMPRLAWHTCPR